MARDLLLLPTLAFSVNEDGTLRVLSPWYQSVAFSPGVLAHADGRRVALRGDELIVRCTNGGAAYALGEADEVGARVGTLLRSWS